MNALTLQGGKIYLVPDVPEKPVLHESMAHKDLIYSKVAELVAKSENKEILYHWRKELNQALSNKIEVAEESREFAKALMTNSIQVTDSLFNATVKEGELYPIEGLEYKIVGKTAVLTYKK